jgi:hypothetical protein
MHRKLLMMRAELAAVKIVRRGQRWYTLALWKRAFKSSKTLPKARKVIAIFTNSFRRKSGSIFF